ncbi:hypothetical protein [Sphingomonas sp. PR090111-T3T-6A]|uniref:hypothetical protein n=1 Tax=Sphingomonas sp. PR090111-T3T-6A TaxID=685778 RepID=UPI0012FCB0D2|nr:hypothetical protein [Sphingomonas sp. PR090111-T3T-6A]
MTYRVAFVRFSDGGEEYPVNCHRSDMKSGDRVIVFLPNLEKNTKLADVVRVEFLDWNCANTLVCRQSEYRGREGEVWYIERDGPEPKVPETPLSLAQWFDKRGWRAYRTRSSVWKVVFIKEIGSQKGLVFFRSRGIDVQILNGDVNLSADGDYISAATREGMFVRNHYFNSGVDLLEYTMNFALAFEEGLASHPPVSRGESRRGTRVKDTNEGNDDDLAALRRVIGDGGPVYLCDGVWI